MGKTVVRRKNRIQKQDDSCQNEHCLYALEELKHYKKLHTAFQVNITKMLSKLHDMHQNVNLQQTMCAEQLVQHIELPKMFKKDIALDPSYIAKTSLLDFSGDNSQEWDRPIIIEDTPAKHQKYAFRSVKKEKKTMNSDKENVCSVSPVSPVIQPPVVIQRKVPFSPSSPSS